ncbi:hypothetical protein BESB_075360 [Besnoitia besnoiti]|uniref:Transmembrane protein n=1 Tax=Besnoitia besnoiti TaxID=94643 RepID=A0A2A9MB11_BESBE|nr:uncharacterized protein BESB_075360 [Besnoitia besnoiti]PFH34384.1 hypothetical protein BESB_075360 [Besnoitia besnoiti]
MECPASPGPRLAFSSFLRKRLQLVVAVALVFWYTTEPAPLNTSPAARSASHRNGLASGWVVRADAAEYNESSSQDRQAPKHPGEIDEPSLEEGRNSLARYSPRSRTRKASVRRPVISPLAISLALMTLGIGALAGVRQLKKPAEEAGPHRNAQATDRQNADAAGPAPAAASDHSAGTPNEDAEETESPTSPPMPSDAEPANADPADAEPADADPAVDLGATAAAADGASETVRPRMKEPRSLAFDPSLVAYHWDVSL